jgi:hypothetical protein
VLGGVVTAVAASAELFFNPSAGGWLFQQTGFGPNKRRRLEKQVWATTFRVQLLLVLRPLATEHLNSDFGIEVVLYCACDWANSCSGDI